MSKAKPYMEISIDDPYRTMGIFLRKFVGAKVVLLERTKGLLGDYFILTFDNGHHLAGVDGEYGDNAFDIITEEEYQRDSHRRVILDKRVQKKPVKVIQYKRKRSVVRQHRRKKPKS